MLFGADLVHLYPRPLGAEALGLGHDDDALGEPVVGLLAAALGAADPQLPLELLYEPILRAALVDDDGTHLPAQEPVAVHGVHVGCLLSAPDHGLELGEGGSRQTPPDL